MKFLEIENTDIPATVEDEDYERLSKFKWYANGYWQHITRYDGYLEEHRKHVALANEVMQKYGIKFDHKDRNTFNNLHSNLRECTHIQNAMNSSKRKGTSSKYKGVCWDKFYKKWRVKITRDRKQVYLGLFCDELLAASAYNKAAKILFKEFAVLNTDQNGNILDYSVDIPELNMSLRKRTRLLI